MNWSYSGNPANSPLDEVRFLLGDTRQTSQSLSDDEILYLLSLQENGNVYFAAADAALRVATHFDGLSSISKRVGDLTLETDYASTASRYRALAEQLMKGRTQFSPGSPTLADTTDSQFYIGIMDDPNGYGLPKKLGGYV